MPCLTRNFINALPGMAIRPLARRKEQQDAERREREEKQRRLEEAKRRKEEAAASAAAAAAAPRAQVARPARDSVKPAAPPAAAAAAAPAPASGTLVPSAAGENRPLNGGSASTILAEAKQRLQRIQEAAIQQAAAAQQQGGGTAGGGHASGHSVNSKPAVDLKQLAFGAKPGALQQPSGGARVAAPAGAASAGTAKADSKEPAGPQTYEISPYKYETC